MPPSRWTSVDYALDWPRELLAEELVALCGAEDWSWTPADVARLLREAFHSDKPVAVFEKVSSTDSWHHFSVGPDGTRPALPEGQTWINELLSNIHQLREYRPPAPLWRQRQQSDQPQAPTDARADARRAVAELMSTLYVEGYLAERFPETCVDDPGDLGAPADPRRPADRLRDWLASQLGAPGNILWPPIETEWEDGLFYDLIEAWHDLISRPRRQWLHEEEECGNHFADFDTDAGRRIYRNLINRILAERGLELRLADADEDEGRLVWVTDPGREELLDRVLTLDRPGDESGVAERVRHAVSLFRRRDTTEHDKRSAVIALAGILEERRELIRADLGRKDEGALFTLANEFAIRHQRRGQHDDYDPAFLDWMFWWYLATVELTDRIGARDQAATS